MSGSYDKDIPLWDVASDESKVLKGHANGADTRPSSRTAGIRHGPPTSRTPLICSPGKVSESRGCHRTECGPGAAGVRRSRRFAPSGENAVARGGDGSDNPFAG